MPRGTFQGEEATRSRGCRPDLCGRARGKREGADSSHRTGRWEGAGSVARPAWQAGLTRTASTQSRKCGPAGDLRPGIAQAVGGQPTLHVERGACRGTGLSGRFPRGTKGRTTVRFSLRSQRHWLALVSVMASRLTVRSGWITSVESQIQLWSSLVCFLLCPLPGSHR